uniref:Nudix hydrolase 12, mitochondrial n=2 Tax=Anthurium amnicola TaxID=1678845 RepID=A0A1D1XMI1_9ARAE
MGSSFPDHLVCVVCGCLRQGGSFHWEATTCADMDQSARTGRQRQRYDGHYRLVAGCIPYRLKQNVKDKTASLVDRLEVLMISSPNRDDLVFPKGGWEDDETIDQAACREAFEEAGIRGIIHGEHLGMWVFRSKSRQNSCSQEGACKGYMFALQVTEELDSWAEESCHKRRWLSVPEAWNLCRYPWMREALEKCVNDLNQAAQPASDPSCYVKPSAPERLDSTMNALCCRSS